jgi:ZIP family zinc transporter
MVHIEPLQILLVKCETSTAIGTTEVLTVIAITAFAGGTSFLGALIARKRNFSEQQVLFFTAFGAGILMAAAIFEMVIEAETTLGIALTLFSFLVGAIIFTLADLIAEKKGGGAGILLGIGLDSIPESLAIGASIASAGPAMALAILIGIQNVPEGIASYREMMSGKTAFKSNPKKALAAIGIVSIIPIFLGLVGLFYMQGMAEVIAIILALSAGGIFYMLYYDMIPKAHKERKWLPTFGAVLGFIIGFAIVRTIGG